MTEGMYMHKEDYLLTLQRADCQGCIDIKIMSPCALSVYSDKLVNQTNLMQKPR